MYLSNTKRESLFVLSALDLIWYSDTHILYLSLYHPCVQICKLSTPPFRGCAGADGVWSQGTWAVQFDGSLPTERNPQLIEDKSQWLQCISILTQSYSYSILSVCILRCTRTHNHIYICICIYICMYVMYVCACIYIYIHTVYVVLCYVVLCYAV